ncbi:MAG: SDR family oxidoreductase [Polyangiaceae bacterium]|nr:SDR family oxidoreductase [Polyangiaceae bacterium]
MRLFVLGATGRTGGEIVDVALARGHEITAYARSPQKLTPRERLRVAAGELHDVSALAKAMRGHDAVLSAVGPPARDAFKPCTLMTDVAASTVAGMTTAGVSRLGIVSAAVLFQEPGIFYAFFRWFLRHHRRDLETMEAVVTATDLSWTIARPPRLVQKPVEQYRAASGSLPPNHSFSTSFRSVAAFLVDAIEGEKHVQQVVGVTQ